MVSKWTGNRLSSRRVVQDEDRNVRVCRSCEAPAEEVGLIDLSRLIADASVYAGASGWSRVG